MDPQDTEIHEESTDGCDQQQEDARPEDEGEDISDNNEENGEQNLRRSRGRPKLMKTGKPGRPKKIYHQHNNTECEPANVAEAMNRSDWSA